MLGVRSGFSGEQVIDDDGGVVVVVIDSSETRPQHTRRVTSDEMIDE